ncbi:MAG: anti-sigma factor [Phycisphaeraceae bacterium]|nr:MAG: anti-sigma factor [Phycisphaeraceae bacterium]
MSNTSHHNHDARLHELLADHALGRLAPDDAAELIDRLRRPHGTGPVPDFEHAAAALLPALGDAPPPPLPPAARARLQAIGESIVRAQSPSSAPRPAPSGLIHPSLSAQAALAWVGWAAAAAAITFSFILYSTRRAPTPAVVPDYAHERRTLLEAPDLLNIDWQPGPDPSGNTVKGDIVWSNTAQKGFMRISGLSPNDPAREQYQLWIFDQGRTDPERGDLLNQFPVDGGVFDIRSAFRDPATGDYIVPINAKLQVRDPAVFAVTVEEPGGVVVTKKQRLLMIASPK